MDLKTLTQNQRCSASGRRVYRTRVARSRGRRWRTPPAHARQQLRFSRGTRPCLTVGNAGRRQLPAVHPGAVTGTVASARGPAGSRVTLCTTFALVTNRDLHQTVLSKSDVYRRGHSGSGRPETWPRTPVLQHRRPRSDPGHTRSMSPVVMPHGPNLAPKDEFRVPATAQDRSQLRAKCRIDKAVLQKKRANFSSF